MDVCLFVFVPEAPAADFLRVVVLAQAPRARARETIRSMLVSLVVSMLMGNLTSMLVGAPGASPKLLRMDLSLYFPWIQSWVGNWLINIMEIY